MSTQDALNFLQGSDVPIEQIESRYGKDAGDIFMRNIYTALYILVHVHEFSVQEPKTDDAEVTRHEAIQETHIPQEETTVIIPEISKEPTVTKSSSSKKSTNDWINKSKMLFETEDPEWTKNTLVPFLTSLSDYFVRNQPRLLEQIQQKIKSSKKPSDLLDKFIRATIAQGKSHIKGSYSHIFAHTKQLLGQEKNLTIYQYLFFYPFDQDNVEENIAVFVATPDNTPIQETPRKILTEIPQAIEKTIILEETKYTDTVVEKTQQTVLENSQPDMPFSAKIKQTAPDITKKDPEPQVTDTPAQKADLELGSIEDFQELIELSDNFEDMTNLLNTLHHAVSVTTPDEIFQYIWTMTRNIKNILADRE